MKKSNIPMIIIIILLISLALGSTYAFLQITNPEGQVQGVAGCFEIDYTGVTGKYQNYENKLESSTNYNESYINEETQAEEGFATVTLAKNENCKIYNEATINLHTESGTADDGEEKTSSDLLTKYTIDGVEQTALKYTVLNSSGTIISEGSIFNTGATPLATVDLTDTEETYKIYIWVDSNITYNNDQNITYHDLRYSGYIYVDATQTSTYTS